MRVLDISPTAGYASLHIQNNNPERSTNCSFPETAHNRNCNFEHVDPSSNHESSHVSAAGEFIQNALTSLPTKFKPNIQRTNCPDQGAPDYCYTDIVETDSDLNALYSGDTTCNNTYRSYKEVFNINRAFFEDCIKNFENINTLENINEPTTHFDTLDGITVTNSDLQTERNINSLLDINSVSESHHIDMKNSVRNSEEIGDFSYHEFKEPKHLKNPCIQLGYETDQDMINKNLQDQDQLVPDIINESTKSADVNDDFLISPTSSTTSLRPSKRTYFPRGIINPNYPGFQHLAHTLSEDFISCTLSDSYDSEMSEHEMEFSGGSFDDLPEDHIKFNTNFNNFNNNHRKTECSENDENKDNDCCTVGAKSFNDTNCNISLNEVLPDNREKLFTFSGPSKSSSEYLEQYENSNQQLNCTVKKSVCATPDILLKNFSLHVDPLLKKQNRPDLLRSVSPCPQFTINKTMEYADHSCDFANAKQSVLLLPHHKSSHMSPNDNTKDEISLGITPVDIIGDFGEEVEREFGLLVSGYRRLVDGTIEIDDNSLVFASDQCDNIGDAALSNAGDQIDSNKILAALNQLEGETMDKERLQLKDSKFVATTSAELIDGYRAIDLSCKCTGNEYLINVTNTFVEDMTNGNRYDGTQKPKYQKPSYDDRQLPPVAIDYKRCQQSLRTSRKIRNSEKAVKRSKIKVLNSNSRGNSDNRFSYSKRLNNGLSSGKIEKIECNVNRMREEAEIYQYQQLISNKEQILSNSKYSKMSSWAQYLKNAVNERGSTDSSELISPSALELFDAYKIGTEIDMETLQKHLKLAKEIEKKRRSDREEIRRRLAMGVEENHNEKNVQPSIEQKIQNGMHFSQVIEPYSDTESHSSDSETCPKLSKSRQHNSMGISDRPSHIYNGVPISISYSYNFNKQLKEKQSHKPQQRQQEEMLLSLCNDDVECDFFTKQAKLQIEARMALAQAKEMAHMQMQIDRQNQRISPITDIIRGSLKKIGVMMGSKKRRVSRQMLTDMNTAQLQILVNSLHSHIEELNKSLVELLVVRDDLHIGQDSMLVDIEELTRYLGANEHIAQKGAE